MSHGREYSSNGNQGGLNKKESFRIRHQRSASRKDSRTNNSFSIGNHGLAELLPTESVNGDLIRCNQIFGAPAKSVMFKGTANNLSAQSNPPGHATKYTGTPVTKIIPGEDLGVPNLEERKSRMNALSKYIKSNGNHPGEDQKEVDETKSNIDSDFILYSTSYPNKGTTTAVEPDDSPAELEELHNCFVAFHQKSKMLLRKLENVA